MKTIYAFIWKSSVSEAKFEQHLPVLVDWLAGLRNKNQLRGCGAWLNDNGGLTLVEAAGLEDAQKINALNPLNKIGTTEIFEWEVFYAHLVVDKQF